MGAIDTPDFLFQSLEKCFVSISETIAQRNSDSCQKGFLKLRIRNVFVSMMPQNICCVYK